MDRYQSDEENMLFETREIEFAEPYVMLTHKFEGVGRVVHVHEVSYE